MLPRAAGRAGLRETLSCAFRRMLKTCGFCFSACVCMVCNAPLHVYGSTWCVPVCVEVGDLCPQNHSITIYQAKAHMSCWRPSSSASTELQSATAAAWKPCTSSEVSPQALSSCKGLHYCRGFFPIKHVNIDCLLWIDIKNSIGKLSFTFFL